MPFTPTIGVPFIHTRLSNGDGTFLTVTITVIDGAGRFTASVDNGSARPTEVIVQLRAGGSPINVTIPPGVTEVPIPGARRWQTTSLSISSA